MIFIKIYEENRAFVILHKLSEISSPSFEDCKIFTHPSYLQFFVKLFHKQFDLLRCIAFVDIYFFEIIYSKTLKNQHQIHIQSAYLYDIFVFGGSFLIIRSSDNDSTGFWPPGSLHTLGADGQI